MIRFYDAFKGEMPFSIGRTVVKRNQMQVSAFIAMSVERKGSMNQ